MPDSFREADSRIRTDSEFLLFLERGFRNDDPTPWGDRPRPVHRYLIRWPKAVGFDTDGNDWVGQFDIRTHEGILLPVIIDPSGNAAFLDPTAEVLDVCVDDRQIVIWQDACFTYCKPRRLFVYNFAPDDPFDEPFAAMVAIPQYAAIDNELREGRPHPGAAGGLR